MNKEKTRRLRRRLLLTAAAAVFVALCVLIYEGGGGGIPATEVPGGFFLRVGVLERSGAATVYELRDEAQIKAVHDYIRAQRSERLRDRSAAAPDYPFLCLSDEGQNARRAVYANGVWLDGHGRAYEIALDPAEILARMPDAQARQGDLRDFPERFLAATLTGRWDARLLERAEAPLSADELITRAKERSEDRLSVTVFNPNDYAVRCRPDVLLDVELDGVWYAVPATGGAEDAAEELVLEPDGSAVFSASVKDAERRYGALPAGHYRAVLLTYAAEFDVG